MSDLKLIESQKITGVRELFCRFSKSIGGFSCTAKRHIITLDGEDIKSYYLDIFDNVGIGSTTIHETEILHGTTEEQVTRIYFTKKPVDCQIDIWEDRWRKRKHLICIDDEK